MIGLAFSGGKDSWACLHKYRNELDKIIVLWVNTGKNFPELIENINLAKSMCPNFVEIKTDKDLQNSIHGLPSDIIPFSCTSFGEQVTGKVEQKIQSYFQCCYENISEPLNKKVKELGITHLISGKRNDEKYLSSHANGSVVNGVTHIHPNENMTKKQILDYLSTVMELPNYFYFEHSSLDCYDCSAYLKDTKDIFEWSKINHPELHKKKVIKINIIKDILTKEMQLGFGE